MALKWLVNIRALILAARKGIVKNEQKNNKSSGKLTKKSMEYKNVLSNLDWCDISWYQMPTLTQAEVSKNFQPSVLLYRIAIFHALFTN